MKMLSMRQMMLVTDSSSKWSLRGLLLVQKHINIWGLVNENIADLNDDILLTKAKTMTTAALIKCSTGITLSYTVNPIY